MRFLSCTDKGQCMIKEYGRFSVSQAAIEYFIDSVVISFSFVVLTA